MIFDLHNDYPTVLEPERFSEYVSTDPDVTVTAAVWTTDFGSDGAQKTSRLLRRLYELKSKKDFPIAIEDLGFCATNGQYERFDFSQLFYCTLTWNYANAFAGGALSDGILTDEGRRVISCLNSFGVYIDVAHLNKRSFYDVLECAERVICSHTGFTDHPRCLDDAQIKALIGRNAVIGLSAVSAFSGASTACAFADVIDGFVQRYGEKCLAIGTDYFGSADIPEQIDSYDKLNSVKQSLYSRGYTPEQVSKIFYGNASDLYSKRR